MGWFDTFATNLGNQSAPFGPMPGYDPKQQGINMIGNIGMNMLANSTDNPMTALGKGYQQAQTGLADQQYKALMAQNMMSEMDARKRDEARKNTETQRQLDQQSAWQNFAKKNADKFGSFGEIAPFLPPDEGMKILSGMQPDYRPMTPEEKAAYGVDASQAAVMTKEGPKVLGGSQVNIDMKGETKFDEEMAKAQAGRYNTILEEGQKANGMLGDINALREIGANLNTGKGAEITAALGPYAEMLGVQIDGLGEMQAYEAIVAKIAPSLRTPGVGAMSDYELRQFIKALPGLGKTEEGNALIQATLESVAEHKRKAAEIVERMNYGEFNRKTADRMLRELPDPWTMWKQNKDKFKTTAPTTPPAQLKQKYGLE